MENKKRFQRELEAAFRQFVKIAFICGIDCRTAGMCEGQITGAIVGAKSYDGITQKQAESFFDVFAKINRGYKKNIVEAGKELTTLETYDLVEEYSNFVSEEIQKILGE